MKQQIIVVEGFHDEAVLKQYFGDIETISVGGSRVDKDKLDLLIKLKETHEIILFLDPDSSGERIRSIISRKVTNCKHAFIDKELCYSKNRKKIGIEHASKGDIQRSLAHMVRQNNSLTNNSLRLSDLVDLGLVGHVNSEKNRHIISKHFGIGYTNGKQLLKRLNWLSITKEELSKVVYES